MTPREEREIDAFLARLRGGLDTNVTFSHVLRALVKLTLDSQKKIVAEAKRNDIDRPRNGDMKATVKFESELGRIFHTALKRAKVQ